MLSKDSIETYIPEAAPDIILKKSFYIRIISSNTDWRQVHKQLLLGWRESPAMMLSDPDACLELVVLPQPNSQALHALGDIHIIKDILHKNRKQNIHI